MSPFTENPVAGGDRAPTSFCSAAERPGYAFNRLPLQARSIAGAARGSYEASRIKRQRASASEMEARRSALIEIVASAPPMTTRQVFYQATVRGLVEKTEAVNEH